MTSRSTVSRSIDTKSHYHDSNIRLASATLGDQEPQRGSVRRSTVFPVGANSQPPMLTPTRFSSPISRFGKATQQEDSNAFPAASNTPVRNPPPNQFNGPGGNTTQEPMGQKFESQLGSATETEIITPYGSISLIDDIMLPALESGPIRSLNVTEGQFIEKGAIVGVIDDMILKSQMTEQEIRYRNVEKLSKDTVAYQAASKEYDLAIIEYEKTKRLHAKRSRSESELMQAKFQAQIAKLKIQKSINDRESAEGEARLESSRLDSIRQRINRHVLTSDYDAYVVEIFKKPQEFVNVGDEVMRLGRMDELWAQANVSVKQLDVHEALNRPVTVELRMARGETEVFTGRIEQIPLENQSSDQYAVKVRVKNRRAGPNKSWILRPLAQVKMTIHLDRGFINDDQMNR